MLIKVGNFDITEVWDGVFYKKLSNYPELSNWEMRNIIEFIEYEKNNGRECEIECDNKELLNKIKKGLNSKELYLNAPRPNLITECTACPYRKGCVTNFVCHTTSIENAKKIFKSGKLFSAVKARNITAQELAKERRNAANDPLDYFEYVMFSWGNCQAGDRLVMERKLNRFPNDEDLSINFTPGVRFFFKYDVLKNHPNVVYDGVLPMKIKDEVIISEWIDKIVIPKNYQEEFEEIISNNLVDKIIYIENDCKDIWDWSEKVYRIIESKHRLKN